MAYGFGMRQQLKGWRWGSCPGRIGIVVFMLAVQACAGAKPITVSDNIYTAPGRPDAIFSAVLERATTCWPQSGGELATLSIVGEPVSDGNAPIIRLFPPAPADAAASSEAPAPAFAVEFRASGQSTTLSFPSAPEDEALDRKLKDDVLLWANGSRACG